MFTIEYKLPEKGTAVTVDDMKEIDGAVLVPERFLHRRELFKNTPIFLIRLEGITPDAQATFMDDPRLVADHVINWLLKVTKQLDAAFEDFDEALALLGGIVFRIFRQVAMGARFGDGGDHSRPFDCLQTLQFVA